MSRRHTFVVAALLAISVIAGGFALGHTLGLGAAASNANDKLVATRTRQLNQFERRLHQQLASTGKTPAVATPTPHTQPVIYVRPKPIVVTKHHVGGEVESEHEEQGEGGFDD